MKYNLKCAIKLIFANIFIYIIRVLSYDTLSVSILDKTYRFYTPLIIIFNIIYISLFLLVNIGLVCIFIQERQQ